MTRSQIAARRAEYAAAEALARTLRNERALLTMHIGRSLAELTSTTRQRQPSPTEAGSIELLESFMGLLFASGCEVMRDRMSIASDLRENVELAFSRHYISESLAVLLRVYADLLVSPLAEGF